MSGRWVTHFGGRERALPELTATLPFGTSGSLQEVTRQKSLLQVVGNKVVLEGHRLTRGDDRKSLCCNKLLAKGDNREKIGLRGNLYLMTSLNPHQSSGSSLPNSGKI